MGKLAVLAFASFVVSGCGAAPNRHPSISYSEDRPASAEMFKQDERPAWPLRTIAQVEREERRRHRRQLQRRQAAASQERRRREAEETHRRWFKSLTKNQQAQFRQRERELGLMLEALAART